MAMLLVAYQVGGLLDVQNILVIVSEEMCVASLQAEKQIHLASCLDKLMTDVQRNLEPKNRDRFTQVRILLICFCTHVQNIALSGTLELAAVSHMYRSCPLHSI